MAQPSSKYPQWSVVRHATQSDAHGHMTPDVEDDPNGLLQIDPDGALLVCDYAPKQGATLLLEIGQPIFLKTHQILATVTMVGTSPQFFAPVEKDIGVPEMDAARYVVSVRFVQLSADERRRIAFYASRPQVLSMSSHSSIPTSNLHAPRWSIVTSLGLGTLLAFTGVGLLLNGFTFLIWMAGSLLLCGSILWLGARLHERAQLRQTLVPLATSHLPVTATIPQVLTELPSIPDAA
jgi:hypothetical protein